MSDDRHAGTIAIAWADGIGRVMLDGELWANVEWSEKRQQWCIEDVEGRCLTHTASIRGQAASKQEAAALAEAMIRDGRMPSPTEARKQHRERRRIAREKRAKQPSEQKRKAAIEREREARRLHYETEQADGNAQPFYEALDEAFDLADPELWKSNSFAALKPRLILHVEAAVAKLAWEDADMRRPHGHFGRRASPAGDGLEGEAKAKFDRALAIYRKLTGAEWTPKPSEMSQIVARLKESGRL